MKAFITGITGQDGSYLAEFLLNKKYEVWGMVRRSSTSNRSRIDSMRGKIHLVYGDMADGNCLASLIQEIQPDEVYNLAAQSQIRISFDQPVYSVDIGGLGTLRLLEAIRLSGLPVRFYQASSSEMYGQVFQTPQNETTPFHPRSPYGCAKVYSYWQTINHREAYNLFACNGILFNHESPRRGESFVTRKITKAVASIKHGEQIRLPLGNLAAKRDWGFAGDYVEAMWMMLHYYMPDDYVIATGETHSVQEFLEEAFGYVDLNWHDWVDIDPYYFRPTEVDLLCGDASKAKRTLEWEPTTSFQQLVRMMVDADMVSWNKA